MSSIEILMSIVTLMCCLGVAQILRMRNRYQQHERAWEGRLRIVGEAMSAAQREVAAAHAVAATVRVEALEARVEISVTRSIAVEPRKRVCWLKQWLRQRKQN